MFTLYSVLVPSLYNDKMFKILTGNGSATCAIEKIFEMFDQGISIKKGISIILLNRTSLG